MLAGFALIGIAFLFAAAMIFLGVRAHPKPNNDFLAAVQNDDSYSVRADIESGSSPNAIYSNGHSVLYQAAENGDQNMVHFLLQSGASPNADVKGKSTPLDVAAMLGNMSMVADLVASGANLQPSQVDGQTPLHAASTGGNVEIVRFFLNKGLNPNARRSTDDATPICDAASAGKWNCIELLRAYKGDIDLTGFAHRTPLTLAILARHPDVATKLIDSGGDVNIADKQKSKPLSYALLMTDFEVAKQLLPRTKNMAAYDLNGNNALYYAVSANAPLEIVSALVDAGCKNAQLNNRPTPILEADPNDRPLIDLLKKAGGKLPKR